MDFSSALPANLLQRTFGRRDLVPLRQDCLWRIEAGVVRTLTWNQEGTPSTLGIWGPGDLIGKPLSRVNPYQIECLTHVEVSILPVHLWYQVLDALLLHVQQAEEILSIVQCKRVPLGLLQLLVWLAQKFGREVERGQQIDLSLTHQELAELIGTTRVTVTRLLNQFEHEGIICRRRHHLTLLGNRRHLCSTSLSVKL